MSAAERGEPGDFAWNCGSATKRYGAPRMKPTTAAGASPRTNSRRKSPVTCINECNARPNAARHNRHREPQRCGGLCAWRVKLRASTTIVRATLRASHQAFHSFAQLAKGSEGMERVAPINRQAQPARDGGICAQPRPVYAPPVAGVRPVDSDHLRQNPKTDRAAGNKNSSQAVCFFAKRSPYVPPENQLTTTNHQRTKIALFLLSQAAPRMSVPPAETLLLPNTSFRTSAVRGFSLREPARATADHVR